MTIINYPCESDVKKTIADNEPLLMLISFDGQTVILSHVDEAIEHHILLMKAGFSDRDIDKYFRIVLDDEGADWTFICPPDYKNISDKTRRIKQFYKDGFSVISNVLQEIGFMVGINIPKRYRRHFDIMMEE
ncbi:MAG: hypothetical protein K2F81_00195 [Ruminococcus sp.]|nr:hypothetical protein [Ruminococcus sp.]